MPTMKKLFLFVVACFTVTLAAAAAYRAPSENKVYFQSAAANSQVHKTVTQSFSSDKPKIFNAAFASENPSFQYARILEQNVAFYSDPSCTLIKFYLPYSYFVRVITAGESVTKATYMDGVYAPAKEGYIKTADLYAFDGSPQQPFPMLRLTLATEEVIFADPNSGAKAVLESGTSAAYYGEIKSGGVSFYYVYAGGHIGYVRASAFFAHNLPLSADPLPEPDTDTITPIDDQPSASNEQPSKSNGGEILTAVIIVAVSLATLSVIYAAFRPRGSALKNAASSDNDDF